MNKLFGYFLLLLLTGTAFSNASAKTKRGPASMDPLKGIACEKQINAQLDQWAWRKQWLKKPDTGRGAKVYASPTRVAGAWVRLFLFPGGEVSIERQSPERTVTLEWNTQTCISQMKTRDHPVDPEVVRTTFTDLGLQRLMDEHTEGMVYAWSPEMPLCQQGVSDALHASEKLGVPLFFVLDPNAAPETVEGAKRNWGIKTDQTVRIHSLELLNWGVLDHFPSLTVFKNHVVLGPPLMGLKNEEYYVTYTKKKLAH